MEGFQLFSFPNLQTCRFWKYASFCYLASHILLLLFTFSFHKRRCNTMFNNFTSQPTPYEVFINSIQNVLHCIALHTFTTFSPLTEHKEDGGSKPCTYSVWKFVFVTTTAVLLNKGYHKTFSREKTLSLTLSTSEPLRSCNDQHENVCQMGLQIGQ